MFPACIFPYPAGLFFLMLMIFRLRWLLAHTGATCEGFNVFFLYFPERRPVWEFPFPFQRLSSSTGGPRRTETPPPNSRFASPASCSIPPPLSGGLAFGLPHHWKPPLTS